MRIGLFLQLFSERKLDDLLPYLVSKGVTAVELYVGPLAEDNKLHCDPDLLLADKRALQDYKKLFADHGVIISGLNVSGNPVHPVKEIAHRHNQSFERGIRLAAALEVDRVMVFSGCPGGSPVDQTPNWVCCPWPDEYSKIVKYQWEEVLIPYWKSAAAYAQSHGITKIGVEMHPGFCVYNPETLLKLRKHVGDIIGANLDPSHLLWQGINAEAAVKALSGAIYHTHIKDVRMNTDVVRHTGVIDTKSYDDLHNRAWVFSTVGYGHDTLYWKRFVNALHLHGYNHVLSIEHEDSYMSRVEGFEKGTEFLNAICIREAPEEMWWA